MGDSNTPIVADLGKKKRKTLKQLKKGEGPAIDEVNEAVAHARAQLGSEATGKTIVPVVVVYEKRRERGSWI